MKIKELIRLIEEIAPPHRTEDWDNSGIQIQTQKEEIGSVLVALEIDQRVIKEAEKKRADFILTHHPLIFDPLRKVEETDRGVGAAVGRLLRTDTAVYAAHLTFDNAPQGNNAYLAALLGMEDAKRPEDLAENIPLWIGTWQDQQKASLWEVRQTLREVLDLPGGVLRTVGRAEGKIHRVAICTGAGSGFVQLAAEKGCDLLVTGDVKYHDARRAQELGLSLIDGGHYGTEKIFVPNMAAQLRERVGDRIVVNESAISLDPFVWE